MTRVSWLAMALFLTSILAVYGQTAESIVRKMDDMQSFNALYSEGEMISTDRFGVKKSSFRTWSRNKSREMLLEFTNVEERGQKILKIDSELYLFYPDAEDIIPMEGSALKQSMFGDVSYEDVADNYDTLDRYSARITGSINHNGADCWKIELIAKTRKVAYPKQVLVVGKDDLILRAAEYYAKSGRLLKTLNVLSHRIFPDGKVLLTEMELEDRIRRNSKTLMHITHIDPNPEVNDRLFSLQSLY